ncbi:hypothetical protein [Demequina litorisediminis]|uniref:hypothetical protein n=1 Tax=Demequina litorisediminis TaxID=1849022 RepID=UPI0024E0D8DE|nr:hypothetical protein [Demequina litorisediminis]
MRPLDPRLVGRIGPARRYIVTTAVLGLATAVAILFQALLIARALAPVLAPSPLEEDGLSWLGALVPESAREPRRCPGMAGGRRRDQGRVDVDAGAPRASGWRASDLGSAVPSGLPRGRAGAALDRLGRGRCRRHHRHARPRLVAAVLRALPAAACCSAPLSRR